MAVCIGLLGQHSKFFPKNRKNIYAISAKTQNCSTNAIVTLKLRSSSFHYRNYWIFARNPFRTPWNQLAHDGHRTVDFKSWQTLQSFDSFSRCAIYSEYSFKNLHEWLLYFSNTLDGSATTKIWITCWEKAIPDESINIYPGVTIFTSFTRNIQELLSLIRTQLYKPVGCVLLQ